MQKYSQDYRKLLEFINLRAQASETPMPSQRGMKNSSSARPVTSFTVHAGETGTNCILCKNEKHPLYICVRFKAFAHDKMVSTLKDNKICMNCLKPGHFVKQCKSMHRCRKCQKPHHTLLHVEPEQSTQVTPTSSTPTSTNPAAKPVTSHAATGLASNALLMTCCILVAYLLMHLMALWWKREPSSTLRPRHLSFQNAWRRLSVSLVHIRIPRSRELLACLTVPHFGPLRVLRCPPYGLTRRWKSRLLLYRV